MVQSSWTGSAATTLGSVTISISAMVLPTTWKANMARGLPPGAHTAPGMPSIGATWAAWAPPTSAFATARPPRTSGARRGRSFFAVRGCRFHCGAVGAEYGVGVEQGDERFKIPVGCQKSPIAVDQGEQRSDNGTVAWSLLAVLGGSGGVVVRLPGGAPPDRADFVVLSVRRVQ